MEIIMPGKTELCIEHVVFDFNGTLACDGGISEAVKRKLLELADFYKLHVLTADTFGSAAEECNDLPVFLRIIPQGGNGLYKAQILDEIGPENCACLGNGANDIEMFKKAAFSICVLGREGLFASLIQYSDIIVNSVEDGIDLLLNTKRIIAGMRS
jgi:soluble P-type ATPase